ncbi:GLE1-domain-containing protein [Nemania sp. FL0916]|nr:GLE1-domain-containing protein [Nemania sp. FL0916]
MTQSSPLTRRSRQWSSPLRSRMSEFLADNRHTELSYQDALAAAQAEHERVRHDAIRVFNDHEVREECRRLQEREDAVKREQKREEERIRNEERVRAEEERLRALKHKTVPKLPPEPPAPQLNGSGPLNSVPASGPSQSLEAVGPGLKPPSSASLQQLLNGSVPSVNGAKTAQPVPTQSLPFGQNASPSKLSPFASPFQPSPAATPPTAPRNAPATSTSSALPPDQYVVIHQNLKKLRASLAEQAKSLPPLKARMGDMRRELRKSLGQMVTEKGANKKQTQAIQALLIESLNGSVPSALADPSPYVTDQREPMDGAVYNEPQMPSLFLYMMNIFAKAVINQFINECGAQPKAADPLGVIAAQIFSNPKYQWRGKTLIDILMAKFRVVCPVLFGYRGSEKTDAGRTRLGWVRSGAGWMAEHDHSGRMSGLAVGYAAISLRDFSKSANTNPWPPSKYWTSLARILNTPPAEISDTQCVVVRGMIELYEERFIQFYGSAAIAALRSALIDFPSKAPDKEERPAVKALEVVASILQKEIGLKL